MKQLRFCLVGSAPALRSRMTCPLPGRLENHTTVCVINSKFMGHISTFEHLSKMLVNMCNFCMLMLCYNSYSLCTYPSSTRWHSLRACCMVAVPFKIKAKSLACAADCRSRSSSPRPTREQTSKMVKLGVSSEKLALAEGKRTINNNIQQLYNNGILLCHQFG